MPRYEKENPQKNHCGLNAIIELELQLAKKNPTHPKKTLSAKILFQGDLVFLEILKDFFVTYI
jgi:hypothetical protein